MIDSHPLPTIPTINGSKVLLEHLMKKMNDGFILNSNENTMAISSAVHLNNFHEIPSINYRTVEFQQGMLNLVA